ncbi:tripartite tricarboxylate transporter permease [Aquamicrobium sp. LC103]|uniref:tripartite tricarboxylate transporter permease n=1 Tax=Aquamicrobium sp. LC103 TaxID=1120658 RepID=UPI00063EC19D|nr:tripartite tricarboxylate transporter permease [Aquamicrobium sp. LC103]TKT69438.1 tripartite tricarboxylate transporter permease [Aquamicrobium sp. LC103]
MDFASNIALGMSVAITPWNIFYCFVGVTLGTLIGILPGIGPLATMAMLLPATYALEPTSALIMLAGIYYGAQYGGSTSAILLRLPGESSAVVATLDGYAMAQKGKAGVALAIAAIGSLIAGTLGTFVLAAFAPALAKLAITFGAAEYFALMVVGLVAAIVLSSGPILKSLGMLMLGLLFGLVGADINSGIDRFTFGIPELSGGVSFVVVALGLFGITEILSNLEAREKRILVSAKIGRLMPRWSELRQVMPAILRGSGLGSLLGILPGGGVTMAAFASYTMEKRVAADPDRFGKGAPEGLAGPESANNAAAQTSFIPLLTLGIPSNGIMAMMMSAMLIHNVQPGPQIITGAPTLFWGLVASMWIGNLILVILNLPMIGMWVRLLLVPYRLLFPAILLFCCIGLYSVQNNTTDIYLAVICAAIGYVFYKLRCDPVPFLLAFIIGPMLEENFRRATLLSRGDFGALLTRPLTASLLLLAVALLVLAILPKIRRTRKVAFQED